MENRVVKQDVERTEWRHRALPAFHELVQRFSLFSASPRCNTQVIEKCLASNGTPIVDLHVEVVDNVVNRCQICSSDWSFESWKPSTNNPSLFRRFLRNREVFDLKMKGRIGPGGSLSCDCGECAEWHAFVEGKLPDCKEVQYEVLTLEHVKGLAEYLLLRATVYKLPSMNVLEVGAGSGRLYHYLHFYLAQESALSQGCVVRLTATDSGERGLNGPKVAKQDALEAISERIPHVVLVSWMPMGVDWTAHVRSTPSILEYILIGETDSGICGDPWLTWGFVEADSLGDSGSEDNSGLIESNHRSSFGPNSPAGRDQRKFRIPWSFRLCSPRRSTFEGGFLAGDAGLQLTVQESLAKNAQNSKRVSLHPGSLRLGKISSGGRGVIPEPVVSLSEKKLTCDDHIHLDLQSPSRGQSNETSKIPPYTADGWARHELAPLSSLQICRTDERWSTLRHSHTVSFRRYLSTHCHSHSMFDESGT